MGLICLDLDGTLVADALVEVETETGTKLQRNQHELYTEPVLLEGRYDTLKKAAEEGDRFAIVTNQGGVAWGYHTKAEVYRRITSTVGQLSCLWGRPFSVHVAFMHPRATVAEFKGDDGRKPAPTMLDEAILSHVKGMIAMAESQSGEIVKTLKERTGAYLMVGDRDEDREAAEAAGVAFAFVDSFFVLPFR